MSANVMISSPEQICTWMGTSLSALTPHSREVLTAYIQRCTELGVVPVPYYVYGHNTIRIDILAQETDWTGIDVENIRIVQLTWSFHLEPELYMRESPLYTYFETRKGAAVSKNTYVPATDLTEQSAITWYNCHKAEVALTDLRRRSKRVDQMLADLNPRI